jgi:hypothetical protein
MPVSKRKYIISLDEPPETRWCEVIRAYKRKIKAILATSEDLAVFFALGQSAQVACRQLLRALPPEQRQEVCSAAEELGISVHVAAAAQILYEAAVFGETFEALAGNAEAESRGGPRARLGCTAVAVDCEDVPLHARTLDWMMPGVDPGKLSGLLVDLSFTRGGYELYSCTSIAGYLGVLTGVRAGAFSLSINFRKPYAGRWTDLPADSPSNTAEGTSLLEPPSGRLHSLAQLGGVAATALLGGWPVAFLTRHLLETCNSYQAALRLLAGVVPTAKAGWSRGGARVIAPCYVVLIGSTAGEGALVTCEGGLRKHVRQLRESGILATANCDSIRGCDELPAASELRAPFTACTAKDEQQGESLLRRDLALRALRALAPGTASAQARAVLHEMLRAPPIGNEATVHESILCAGCAPHLTSALSPWPKITQQAQGLMDVCCHRGCGRPTWFVDEMRRANSGPNAGGKGRKRRREEAPEEARVPPSCYSGSLPKRRGSMYYCEEHTLRECECSVR